MLFHCLLASFFFFFEKSAIIPIFFFLHVMCLFFFPGCFKIFSLSFVSSSLMLCLEYVDLYILLILKSSQPLSLQNKCLPHSLFLCSLSGTPVIHILDNLMSFNRSILPDFLATSANFGRSLLPLTFSPDLELESSLYLWLNSQCHLTCRAPVRQESSA